MCKLYTNINHNEPKAYSEKSIMTRKSSQKKTNLLKFNISVLFQNHQLTGNCFVVFILKKTPASKGFMCNQWQSGLCMYFIKIYT
jgi:hypothetical protein